MAKLEIGILPHIQNQRKALSAQFFELNPKKCVWRRCEL